MIVLGIDCWDGTKQFVENFRTSTTPSLNYPLLLNGSTTMQAYQLVHNYSTVIDQQGIIRYKASGVNIQAIQQTIDGLLSTAIKNEPEIKKTFRLIGNYPNPFNPSTTIHFSLAKAQKIELQVFDSNGRLIRQLVKDFLQAGQYQIIWNGQDENHIPQPSGCYFYQLDGESREVRKMLLIR